ncbi:B12-binding domain-containing radical SAM protein [Granulicella tundricola]|uniref:Radical SAM domain protein n=1 Tax=Granulicella tundricola (strain ATCC BAA-1859 / DSM 23138 / MP5ACTX9) TaxID=1198114 RepID=E8WYP9_GRATM|nr:radical SAM protein [Granulicella tundricola]ADW67647.1 Radical SAM domain protein [Granulicella tundricola MP5ACTX9]
MHNPNIQQANGESGLVDVLLTHSYHLAHDAKQWRKMQPHPPLGTLYAATALRESGIAVAVFDPMFLEPISGFKQALLKHQPKLVVIYEDDFNFVTKMCLTHMRELARELALIAQSSGITVIAHGSDATDHPTMYLDHGVRYVLNGEAEQTLTELCTSLLHTGQPGVLPGLVHYGGPHHSLNVSSPAPKNPSWACLPRPARELIDLELYRAAWTAEHGFFSTSVVSSRGCPYRCNWCAKPISGDRFQLRSPEEVAAELHDLKSLHGVQHIWFSDDVFALDRRWIQAFATAVESYGTPLPFKIQSRADLMSETTVAALKRAGCAEIWMGVESGSQKILNAMSKGLQLPSVHAARKRLADAGIRACYFLQFGYPGEAWPEIKETIQLVRETQPDDIGVSVSYPLPGTVFFERVQEQLGLKRNWNDSDDLCTIHAAAYKNEFYHALRDALHAEVSTRFSTPDATCEALWQRVHALEPVSRNANVLTLPTVQDNFLPVTSLLSESGRA